MMTAFAKLDKIINNALNGIVVLANMRMDTKIKSISASLKSTNN
jgi:hypothetical protein